MKSEIEMVKLIEFSWVLIIYNLDSRSHYNRVVRHSEFCTGEKSTRRACACYTIYTRSRKDGGQQWRCCHIIL